MKLKLNGALAGLIFTIMEVLELTPLPEKEETIPDIPPVTVVGGDQAIEEEPTLSLPYVPEGGDSYTYVPSPILADEETTAEAEEIITRLTTPTEQTLTLPTTTTTLSSTRIL